MRAQESDGGIDIGDDLVVLESLTLGRRVQRTVEAMIEIGSGRRVTGVGPGYPSHTLALGDLAN